MMKTSKQRTRKKRGRPATGQDPVTAIRLSSALRDAVDRWAARQEAKPSRSEAIRKLVERGLASAPPAAKKAAPKASDLAGREIDRVSDNSATDDERASRKRRLMKGPSEFRDIRRDHPSKKG